MDRIARLKEFLSTSPHDNFVQHALALEYIKEGDDATARGHFEALLQRDPTYVGSYYHLAKLLERTGDTQGAIVCYERGMEQARAVGDRHAYGELQSAHEELSDI